MGSGLPHREISPATCEPVVERELLVRGCLGRQEHEHVDVDMPMPPTPGHLERPEPGDLPELTQLPARAALHQRRPRGHYRLLLRGQPAGSCRNRERDEQHLPTVCRMLPRDGLRPGCCLRALPIPTGRTRLLVAGDARCQNRLAVPHPHGARCRIADRVRAPTTEGADPTDAPGRAPLARRARALVNGGGPGSTSQAIRARLRP